MTEPRLAYALRTLASEAEKLTAQALAPLGLTTNQYDILENIDHYMHNPGRKALRPLRVSESLNLSRHTTGAHIRAFTTSGHARIASGGSRILTNKGIELLATCRIALRAADSAMQDYFNGEYGLAAVLEAFTRKQEENT